MAVKSAKDQKKAVAVGAILILVLAYIYWNYMLKPTNEKIRQHTKELAELQAEIDRAASQAQRLPALQRDLAMLQAEMQEMEKKLPRKRDTADVLRIFTQEALRTRVAIKSFSPSGSQPQDFYIIYPYSVSIETRFHNLGSFLASLGQTDRILNVKDVNLSPGSVNPADGSVLMSVSLTLMAYSLK